MNNIGEKIKLLRQESGITQKQLSDGICDRTFISKIEKGLVHPSADILNKICNKLDIPLDQLEYYHSEENYEYTKLLIADIRRSVQKRDYERVNSLVSSSIHSPHYQVGIMKPFLLWNKGLVLFYLNKENDRAISLLQDALEQIKQVPHTDAKEISIEITLSLAILSIETGNHPQAEDYFIQVEQLLNKARKLSIGSLRIKFYYNISTFYIMKCQYDKGLKFTQLGIKEGKSINKLDYLGDLYYHQGLCKSLLNINGNKEDFENALMIFNIQENQVLYNYVKEKMKKYILTES
ncbi:XRE family transcriptional regulator [Anaerobacillus alkaliphilus]|uniref:XRE family transcriptional regulator n=1 Tax=Anaerobacillus alkaliphilus TaxID=1548597 RepID=A0A4Q0VUT1_9BACI|nr:helix-turn-helix domain-containing protein [Anaerobacillus alkaliphilus]RXJ02174.1 XRE family transcriptional regulator [Anaerobacillus alkaliphilus]